MMLFKVNFQLLQGCFQYLNLCDMGVNVPLTKQHELIGITIDLNSLFTIIFIELFEDERHSDSCSERMISCIC